jgi:hypothetical protein
MSHEKERLLDLGRQDTTTQVTVSVTIYTTPEFRHVKKIVLCLKLVDTKIIQI